MANRESYWILQTNSHISEVYIPEEGDEWTYEVVPFDGIKKGDIVYLWLNHGNAFFGWGEVIETPRIIEYQEPDKKKRRRSSIRVKRRASFIPPITAQIMQRHSKLKKIIPVGFNDLYALPLQTVQAHYLNDFIREHKLDAPKGSAPIKWLAEENSPKFLIQALLTFGEERNEGRLVEAVRIPWFEIIKMISRNPEEIYKIDPFVFEEIIAGAYERAGFDEVILTPRQKDGGKDIIATKKGVGSIRIFDQVKRYSLANKVSIEEVREFIGVLSMSPNVSKGIITTTSTFTSSIYDDPDIKRLMPYRLDVRPRNILLPWLSGLE